MATDFNRAKYSGLDFSTHNDDLLARLQVKFAADFNDFAVSSLGIMLLDLTSFGLDTLSFYLDRRTSDTYLTTARSRKSVARGTRQVGYKMGGAIASSTNLTTSVTEPQAFSVPIPKGFRWLGPDGLIFETAREVSFSPAEQLLTPPANQKLVPVFEGETIQESFVSDGTPFQVFRLDKVPEGKQAVQGTMVVLVDGAEFEEVELLEYGATDQFEAGFNDDPPTVRFGDGVSGNIPTVNATIDVTYVASRGLTGQVADGTITDPETPLVVAFTTVDLTATNLNPSVGGDDLESIASGKAFAPQVFKSRKVAVVGPDYDALSGSYSDPLFGRVAVAKAISSRSAEDDLTLQNYLNDIDTTITTQDTVVSTAVTDLTSATTDLDLDLASITAADTASTETSISSAVGVILAAAETVRNRKNSIDVDASDIEGHVVTGKSQVEDLSPGTVAAIGSITAVAKASLLDGENFILYDGVNIPTTFEFDLPPDGVTVGTVAVDVSGDTTAVQVATSMVSAINGVGAGLLLTATNGGGTLSTVTITNDQLGTVGNVTSWSKTVVAAGFVITQPSGGLGGNGTLSTQEAADLTEVFDLIDAEAGTITGSAAVIDSQAVSILTQANGISTFVVDLTKARSEKDTATTSATANSTLISTATALLDSDFTSGVADINAATAGIFAHVDAYLAADCQANLVTVPILTKDAGGFYVAPSVGLIQSLQTFLDARKEVTQTVAVTSGENSLVPAALTIRVGVYQNYSEEVVRSAVEIAVDGLLRDRLFGAALYELDVERVVESIDGVRFANVSITGPGSRLDSDGNLIPLGSEVVTKGTVTVNTEAVAA